MKKATRRTPPKNRGRKTDGGDVRPAYDFGGGVRGKYRYEVILYWSDPDQAFIAEVPELPGCAADGPSYEAALEAAGGAIRDWIETARELGRPIPEPKDRLLPA